MSSGWYFLSAQRVVKGLRNLMSSSDSEPSGNQAVKSLHARRETRVPSLGWEDPLEKKKATHSSILAWRIPWTEEPGRLQSMGLQRVGHD